MYERKYRKRLFILAIISLPSIIAEWLSSIYFYRFYSLGHAPYSMILMSVFVPTCLWTLMFVFSIIAWRKSWYWYVFIPLLSTYPWMYNNFLVLFKAANISGEWYWVTTFYLWTKAIFYLSALISSVYFIINKIQQRH